ncbi:MULTISPECIES: NrfD/PsrC family molybdoenzyme membrane anchor subunit [unclassified Myxococcus]|uniref:NrfD/PsrC family molybdoenzyme membrane anchor subunit n=1 Tax=unclassified Myxococcus TaxID=2648731 RepID=UPI001CC06E3B|nr:MULTISPECIES: NrfD/PsrC family molybdoenzyme membrane anchor subunit [unclassified Myxococcus]MBZ4397349.1 polysulfide reductase NrfD [Myxococcus sp. AS-1-15]MBZ4410680.1 polysulfide reductase NrfD [Myxococcus sp. XM-1-1-1]
MSARDAEDTFLDKLQRRSDGRNVNPDLGTLLGEGAQQRVMDLDSANPTHGFQARVPSHFVADTVDAPSYHGLAAIKQPVWIATVPAYLFVGGVAGAASLLGLAIDVLGEKSMEPLARRCRILGTAGDMVSAGLLIADLGRPTRFLNMLRVFRPTSPMSVGSWVLALSGALNTVGLVLGKSRGVLGVTGKVAGYSAAMLGMPLAGYTAVLLNNTAVPLWQSTRRTLPLFFMASASASAGSLLSLAPHTERDADVLRPYRLAGKAAEVVMAHAVELDARRAPEVARPLSEGLSGALWKTSRACSVAGLVVDALPGRQRWKQVAADVLTTVGAVAARFAVFHGGQASARNPQATFKPQRQGHGAAEVTGHAVASDGKPWSFPLPVVR